PTPSVDADLPAPKITNPRPRPDPSVPEQLITPTPRAVARLLALQQTEHNPRLALRIAVEAGGCHGFQYLLSLETLPEQAAEISADDTVVDVAGAKLVVDAASLELLAGSRVDYVMELIGRQFKVVDVPGATSSCG